MRNLLIIIISAKLFFLFHFHFKFQLFIGASCAIRMRISPTREGKNFVESPAQIFGVALLLSLAQHFSDERSGYFWIANSFCIESLPARTHTHTDRRTPSPIALRQLYALFCLSKWRYLSYNVFDTHTNTKQ